MRVAILVNGYYGDYNFCDVIPSYDYIICADNGLYHADKLNITPHILIGDFDSVDDVLLKKYQEIPIIKLNPIKDQTDTEYCVDYALNLDKVTEITIFGGVGSRLDHTLANIQLLIRMLKLGVKANIINPHNNIYLIKDKIELVSKKTTTVSLLPLSEKVTGINTKGLQYSLTEGVFEQGIPYGVSNVMTEEKATISITSGLLLIILAND